MGQMGPEKQIVFCVLLEAPMTLSIVLLPLRLRLDRLLKLFLFLGKRSSQSSLFNFVDENFSIRNGILVGLLRQEPFRREILIV